MKLNFVFLVVIAFSFFIFSSCKNEKDIIKGAWIIDTIFYKNYNVKLDISLNHINFEDSKCTPPILYALNPSMERYPCKWRLTKKENKEYEICFDTKDVFLNGCYKLSFFKEDKIENVKIVIESTDLYMVCYKDSYNYHFDKDFLEEISVNCP